MTTSSARKTANMANAAKSTGPKTTQGKNTSGQNARKHGLLSKHLLIQGERRQDYNALLDGLMDAYQPQNLAERILVEKMAMAAWKMRRLTLVETASINSNLLEGTRMQRFSPTTNPVAYALPPNSDRLLRYQAMLDNQYYRAHNTLLQMQSLRANIIEAAVIKED